MHLPRASLAAGLLAAALLAPTAQAASGRATVLSVDRPHHALRLVANGAARTVTVRGRIPAAARTGARVAFVGKGATVRKLRVVGSTGSLVVRGRVVRTTRGLRVRLADGRPLRVGNVVVTLVGFAPGQRVEVRVDVSEGGEINVTVTLLAACETDCPVHLEGVVVAVDPDAGSLVVDGGGDRPPVELAATAEQLDGVAVGDEVEIAGHTTADGVVVDRIEVGGDGDDDVDAARRDVYGRVTAVGADAFELARPGERSATAGEQPQTLRIRASAELLATLEVGELVHVVTHREGDAIVADSVEQVVLPPVSIDVVARVVEVGDGAIVIGDAERRLTVAVASTDGLAAGQRVHVVAHRLDDGSWQADRVEVLPAPPVTPPPPARIELTAPIAETGDGVIVLAGEDARIVIAVASTDGLAVGQRVHVFAHRAEDGSWVADRVVPVLPPAPVAPPPPPPVVVEGWLVSAGDGSVVVLREGVQVVVEATDEQIAALAGAVRVRIAAHRVGETLVAHAVAGGPAPVVTLTGVVVSVGDASFVLRRPERDVTVAATAEQLAGLAPAARVVAVTRMTGPDVFVADSIAPAA